MDLTRREFVIAGGVAGAMAAHARAFGDIVYAGADKGKSVPIERMAMTVCRQCPGGCGLRIRVVNGCVVGIAGNPNHPINRGGICARAPAALQTLYNPDRLTKPALLAGPKGSGLYRPIEWPEAIQRLAAKFSAIRQSPGPQSGAVLINAERGLTRLLWGCFLQAYGSNNLIDWSGPEGHQASPAFAAMQGFKGAVGYDLARARYVLSFGSQWLDAHWSPAQASAALAELRSGRQAARAKFVHIEPRLSLTGAKADEWVPVHPGTEGALALGLAHVLVREGLYDREFVAHLAFGFEDPPGGESERIGFRRLVLRDYAPARVAKITGVEEGTIFRLAREFAARRPAVALGFDGSGVSTQRCYDRMAIHALNALVGSIDVPGGVTHFQDVALLNDPLPEPDLIAEQGLSKPRLDQADVSRYPLGDVAPRTLAERVLADVPYPIELLVLAGANPVFDSPHPERMKQALAKIPFVVSLSPWLDDSAQWADLVIPESHFLTRWDVDVSHTMTGQPAVSIGRPVAAGDGTRSSAELVLELARALGGRMQKALPFSDVKSVVRAICNTLYGSGRGGPFGTIGEVGWTRLLERGGWRGPASASADSFYRSVVENGGWSDPIYYHREWERVFRAPPRKFAFHSNMIGERIKPRTVADDIRCLPHYEPVETAEPGETFPLRLYVYPLSVLAGLNDVNVPWLIDACGAYMGERWQSWVELNPATAARLRIADGESVVVTSPRGRMRARVRLFEGLMPDVVAVPWGLGHEAGGRWSAGTGQNPAALVEIRPDPLTSGPLWNGTRVSVGKA